MPADARTTSGRRTPATAMTYLLFALASLGTALYDGPRFWAGLGGGMNVRLVILGLALLAAAALARVRRETVMGEGASGAVVIVALAAFVGGNGWSMETLLWSSGPLVAVVLLWWVVLPAARRRGRRGA